MISSIEHFCSFILHHIRRTIIAGVKNSGQRALKGKPKQTLFPFFQHPLLLFHRLCRRHQIHQNLFFFCIRRFSYQQMPQIPCMGHFMEKRDFPLPEKCKRLV